MSGGRNEEDDHLCFRLRRIGTKHCSIVTTKPTTTTTTVIGNTAFKTRTEAENSMKTTKVCSSD